MKKIFLIILSVVMLTSFAYAEENDAVESNNETIEPNVIEATIESTEEATVENEKTPDNPEEQTVEQGNYGKRPVTEKSLRYWKENVYPGLAKKLGSNIGKNVLVIAKDSIGYSADWSYYNVDKNGNISVYTRFGKFMDRPFCEWCDAFCSFCVYYAGFTDYPLEISCQRHQLALKAAGYWREWNSYIPNPGDIVFFALEGDGYPSHVGIVESVNLGKDGKLCTLNTIEGNIGIKNPDGTSGVGRVTRSIDHVIGYGTYTKGKTYPKNLSLRFNNYKDLFDETSCRFVDYPDKDIVTKLGYKGSDYYNYWEERNWGVKTDSTEKVEIYVAEEDSGDLTVKEDSPLPSSTPSISKSPSPTPSPSKENVLSNFKKSTKGNSNINLPEIEFEKEGWKAKWLN